MTFSYEDESPQVNTRFPVGLKERLDQYADDHDVPRSEIVREAVREYLPNEAEGGPRDPEQRDTWQWLKVRSNEHNRVPARDAISDLAQRSGMNRDWVKHAKLRPLERAGWITPAHSSIIVHESPQE